MKSLILSIICIATVLYSGDLAAQKVIKNTKLKVNAAMIKHARQTKSFKVQGNFLLAPKNMKFVRIANLTLLVSNTVDAQISDRDYMTYFKQFDFVVDGRLHIVTCSCDYAEDDSEGDNCDFTLPKQGDLGCEGNCSGNNEGGVCKITFRIISPDGVQVILAK